MPSLTALADTAEGLGFIASSIVGRTVGVNPHADGLAWSDGRDIHLDAREAGEAQLAVMIQAALIGAGSLDPGACLRLVGRPALARRYLTLEARRAVTAAADRLPRRLLAHPAVTPLSVVSASAQVSLDIALHRTELPEPHILLGVMRPGAVLRHAGPAKLALAADETGRPKRRDDPVLDDDEAAQESKILKRFSSLAGIANPLADLLKSLIAAGTQPSSDAMAQDGAAEDLSSGAVRRHARAAAVVSTARRPAGEAVSTAALPGVHRYPEWDERVGRYRPAYTRVEDFAPWDDEGRLDLAEALGPPSRALRRQLARLALGVHAHPHHRAGEEIVTDDLIRLVVDLRAGHGGDERIYRALERTRRGLGVLILIDTSASVRDLAPDGRSLQHHQITLGWQIARILDGAGDRVAVYGFNSWGRERVHLMRVKGFGERPDGRATERLARLTPLGFTRIGAAVRHAGAVIEDQSGAPFKLVVLITDGLSYDDGYEAGYAEADTRRALAELRGRRIGCLCLSVGGDADATRLKRLFGEAAFLRADDGHALHGRIGKLFAEAVNSIARR